MYLSGELKGRTPTASQPIPTALPLDAQCHRAGGRLPPSGHPYGEVYSVVLDTGQSTQGESRSYHSHEPVKVGGFCLVVAVVENNDREPARLGRPDCRR